MARTILEATQLANVGGVSIGAGVTPDHTNGNIVPSPGPFHGYLIVQNTGSALSLIVRASGYQGTPAGAANSSYVTGQYQPFATASTGDLTVTLGADVTTMVAFDQDVERFTQSDGSVWLDWSASTDLTAWFVTRLYMP
jgi:hypothetical protein